ncbi:hypothetical protein DFP73DRAFT_529575 [Morchella snyderi]|nr:hypothetical protein DFP73DRAFT_529575 [Morchella snyderi]
MEPTTRSKRRRSDAFDDPTEVEKNPEPMAKRRHGGKPKGAQMFNSHDMNRLLEVLEEVLSIGEDMWDKVEATYNNRAGAATRESRDAKFLKRYYIDLIKSRKPRGNRQRPSNIARAYEIEAAIEERIQMATLNDDEEYESYGEEENLSEYSKSNIIGSDLETKRQKQYENRQRH